VWLLAVLDSTARRIQCVCGSELEYTKFSCAGSTAFAAAAVAAAAAVVVAAAVGVTAAARCCA
jgi:hypothetical protein